MGMLIVVIPFVACYLLGRCLDRQPRWTSGRPAGNADPAAPDVPAEPTTDTHPASGRAKPAGQDERPASAAHPTAAALSLQWTALDQLQLERLLRAAAPRSG